MTEPALYIGILIIGGSMLVLGVLMSKARPFQKGDIEVLWVPVYQKVEDLEFRVAIDDDKHLGFFDIWVVLPPGDNPMRKLIGLKRVSEKDLEKARAFLASSIEEMIEVKRRTYEISEALFHQTMKVKDW